MTIDELERDGWEVIETFGDDLVMAREHQRMLVDTNGNIIIVY